MNGRRAAEWAEMEHRHPHLHTRALFTYLFLYSYIYFGVLPFRHAHVASTADLCSLQPSPTSMRRLRRDKEHLTMHQRELWPFMG